MYTNENVVTLDILNYISSSRLKYHERLANKLNDLNTTPKTYWTILKTFVNGSKIPLISPLLVDNKLVTDILDNVNLLIYLLKTALLYLTITQFPVSMKFETREKLSSLEFCVDDIVKIMRLLDQNKAYVHEEISIRMIKLCTSSISKPLHLIHQRMEKSKYNFCR